MSFAHFLREAWDIPCDKRVSRKKLKPLVFEHFNVSGFCQMKMDLDTTRIRGVWLALSTEHRFAKQLSNNVIVTARSLNQCWERFVYIKEMMHAFDSPEEWARQASDFENICRLSSDPVKDHRPTLSEGRALIRAVLVSCNPDARDVYVQKLNDKELDTYTIATELRIPEQHVVNILLTDTYAQAKDLELSVST